MHKILVQSIRRHVLVLSPLICQCSTSLDIFVAPLFLRALHHFFSHRRSKSQARHRQYFSVNQDLLSKPRSTASDTKLLAAAPEFALSPDSQPKNHLDPCTDASCNHQRSASKFGTQIVTRSPQPRECSSGPVRITTGECVKYYSLESLQEVSLGFFIQE